ncbi:MAG: hypothetical protein IJA58_09215 [Lachnospiraceae bacterium]|nr:hypothetical protein [Lachnospiraceae bacterium]
MDQELKRNVAWVRAQRPVIKADGVFAQTITMNPCVITENDTYYMFYAGDDASGRRQIRLATAPVDDPEHFTFHSVVVENGAEPGSFDYAWCVIPCVVQIKDDLYYMLYGGSSGVTEVGISSFSGIGVAWSHDLIHWEKDNNNPVCSSRDKLYDNLLALMPNGLYKEDLTDGSYRLHLFYVGRPTISQDTVFLNQQKACYDATSPDGIHWEHHGRVRQRTTALDYENIATIGGHVLRDDDGLYRSWHSAIGTRWGIYSLIYAESEDLVHWTRGVRYGENLAFGPESRDIDELFFRQNRWQDQSVSYPCVIREGDHFRMYYCGNEYGLGGIGTAVSTPLRLALTGESGGKAKVWDHRNSALHYVSLSSSVSTKEKGLLTDGVYQEGITYNASVFYEQFPVSADGEAPLSVRAIATNHLDGVHIQIFLHNQSAQDLEDVSVCLEGFRRPLQISFSDISHTQENETTTVHFGTIQKNETVCCHGTICN